MLYANVVLGLPIDGPFDYLIPPALGGKVLVGSRVWVNFRNKKEVAYVVGLSDKTKIKKLKEILGFIDSEPILDTALLALTKRLAQYYCCCWGEAIAAALPDELRKGKEVKLETAPLFKSRTPGAEKRLFFIQGFDRMPVYLRQIKEVAAAGQSAIILFSDVAAAQKAKETIQKSLGLEALVVFRKQPKELDVWKKIRLADYCVVLGSRSSIFAPVNNLGLVIIDQEENQVYKQEQAPHYHAREVAGMRAEIQGAKVILGSHCLSLEGFYLAQKGKLEYESIPSKLAYPLIKVIDARRVAYAQSKNKPIFSKFLADAIYTTLAEQGKVLLVINRKGFATSASCHNCGLALKCPRCNINLVFHFDEDKLKCHHCNFKLEVPKICPSCNAGYIQYSGIGTEKVESELARVFPQGKGNIFVSTGSVEKYQGWNFDLIGVMLIDSSLNRVDFRAGEKTFSLLTALVGLTSKKMIIQSANARHHCFQALIDNDPQLFLKEELKARKQLRLPPFKHMILLKVRGENFEKVKQASSDLFARFNKIKTASIKMLALHPGQPAKLRGNYYYQLLMRAASVEKAGHFLKLHLKETHSSGIIVTIDVDPV